MQLLPDTRLLPLAQPPPASHPRAAAHLLRQILPRDPRLQHEQDPRQHLPIVDPPPPGNRCRLRTFGINGSIQSHSSSETNRLAIVAILSHEVDDTDFVKRAWVPAFR